MALGQGILASKTPYVTGALAIIGAIAGYLTGSITLTDALTAFSLGVGQIVHAAGTNKTAATVAQTANK